MTLVFQPFDVRRGAYLAHEVFKVHFFVLFLFRKKDVLHLAQADYSRPFPTGMISIGSSPAGKDNTLLTSWSSKAPMTTVARPSETA
ncbi:MAG: hypothetical protein H6Q57_251 [Geobacteraceae bacterium]|nr:hypothetical protein [Geobacteraceae bacterium]